MNRIRFASIVCLLMALTFVSCKEEKKEWNNFYGYSNEDIVGEYSYSNAPDAFWKLIESDEGHLCPDAEVTVASVSEQSILFKVVCPDHGFQKNFTGRPTLNQNDFLVRLYTGMSNLKRYGLTAEVLKNEQDDIRLSGFVTEDHYKRVGSAETGSYDTVYDYSVKYYFDVIKN